MIPHQHIDLIHEQHYVYRIFDSSDRLLYVGCTTDPASRLSQHRSRISHYLFMEGRDQEFRSVVSEPMTCYDAYTEEARAIREEAPAYNRARGHVFPARIQSQADLLARESITRWIRSHIPLARQREEAKSA